jgi:carbonic anhydrase
VTYADPIKVAGGAKCLASPDELADREFVLKQIRISMGLHQTKRVILMLHSDCGAYGGLDGGFRGDPKFEAESHRRELIRAADVLRTMLPELKVESYFVDFEGVWQVA